jgi:UDP-3-O-[3-hydroxymyristoyl] glucosamine N-acyltransferase
MIRFKDIFFFLNKSGIDYKYNGSEDGSIEGFCALSDLKKNCITWIRDINNCDIENIDVNLDLLIVTNFPQNDDLTPDYNVIKCNEPRAVFFELLNNFFVSTKKSKIESDSVIETESIGKNVSIGHHCYICREAVLGDNVIIKNNVSIGCPTQIGKNTIIWSGVIIGTDGYGYFKKDDGINYKIPHLGGVKIGENVEIGANTCIDRGTLADTIIGNNVKIDNLCHVAHNVKIEDNVMLTASVTLGGSSILKENVYVAPGAIILNQITVNKDAFVTVGAVVMKNIPENTVVYGNPARVFRNNKENDPDNKF